MKNIVRIIKISKPLHRLVAVIGVLIVITSFLDLVTPVIFKYIVDGIVQKLQHGRGDINRLIFLVALSFCASILSVILTTISDRIGDHFAGRLRQFLTEKFYDKVLTLPQSYFDSEISGKIINQLNRGITSIQNFMNNATNFILPTILQSVFTILVLAYYSVPIALFMFALFPGFILISYYSTKKWGEAEVKKNRYEDSSRGRIQEVIANMSLVKSANNQMREWKFISEKLQSINKIYARQSITFHLFDFLRQMLLNIIIFAVIIILFYNTFRGLFTIGTMVLIIQLVNQARRPLFGISFVLTQIQMAESGSKEFFEILNLPSAELFIPQEHLEKVNNPEIRFSHVSFTYQNSGRILKDVSFTIQPKETVALVGHSGAGKTTIVNLLLKFYNPDNGDIFLNRMNYKTLSHTFVRNNIALVFQDSELFSSTIRDNVSYGNNASEQNVIEALKLANAYDFVQKLPKGIRSEVGERGVRLSGGQKQRIQIARAILKDSPILILDEATSSLDAQSEKEVQEALTNLMENKLVLIIAHRFSTIQNVEKIIVIDEGRIIDSGTPQELASRPGIYADLLHYQIEGNKKLLEKFEIY